MSGMKKKKAREKCNLSATWNIIGVIKPLYSKYLTKEALEGYGDFKIGQVISTVKYANELVLLDNEETVLEGMINRLNDIGKCIGMEMKVKKKLK